MKQIISEEWWCGCYRDDYFLHGGIGGDYNNGYMYGLQYDDYVLTRFSDGSQQISEWRCEGTAEWFKTEQERETKVNSHKDYFLEKIE